MQSLTHHPGALGFGALAIPLAGGSWIFLAFLVIAVATIAYSYFTRRGSGINPRPYAKLYSGAPGAKGPGETFGRDPRPANPWMNSRGMR